MSASTAEASLARLIETRRARAATHSGQEPAAAVLWTDPKGKWSRLATPLLARIDKLLGLGSRVPTRESGS